MSAVTDDAHPTRHDAIHVMSHGMQAMAKHADRVSRENEDLRLRIAELEELATQPITRTVPDISDP